MSSDTYEALLYQIPEKQRSVFIAIAREGKAKEVNSAAFLKNTDFLRPAASPRQSRACWKRISLR